uniref:Wsv269-like protein n=1 Tax=Metapenaeus ensis nimavirus TaxID=2133794 RepID=A0A401IP97_9VIRU|nr:MAG: wsv269-like protein [Metapenaeus ensis nimavirus]GBG35437.1 wsv269-like protein [Metapenaeus ensis nimavirus]
MKDHTNTIRDISFFSLADALAKKAKWINNNMRETSASINVEFGYGGARLMDVRWTGFDSISRLCDCLYYCDGKNLKLRVVGLSAGNVLAYSLALILAVKGSCCGYDTNKPRKRGFIIDRDLFHSVSGLTIPDGIDCVCECLRIIADTLLEAVAIQEHPAWHDHSVYCLVRGTKKRKKGHPSLNLNEARQMPSIPIHKIFSGGETAESILSFGQGTAASGFSDLFVQAPVQYALSMYRAIVGLEGRIGVLYSLVRFLMMFCVEWSIEPDYVNPFFERCEIYLGARRIQGDEGFVFTNLVNTNHIPLVHIASGVTSSDVSLLRADVDRLNSSMNVLMDSVDLRQIIFSHLAEVIWQRKMKRLYLRKDKTVSDIRTWTWDGKISTTRSCSTDYEIVTRCQNSTDIMTNSEADYLPDFEKEIVNSTGVQSLCWNFVFELSPFGKHLFPLEKVSGLFEASLPLTTSQQLKVLQSYREKKMVFQARPQVKKRLSRNHISIQSPRDPQKPFKLIKR